jgi:thiamine biosynthesis lipoprotein ApbE
MGRRTGSQEDGDGKPYEGHGSLTEYVLVNAHRAGISDADFWGMTVHGVVTAAGARRSEASENITRIAYRTARLSRVAHKSFPKSEAAQFNAVKPKKRQSIADQYANAKLITQVMSRGNH